MTAYAKDHALLKKRIDHERQFYKTPSYSQILQKLGRSNDVSKSQGKLDAYFEHIKSLQESLGTFPDIKIKKLAHYGTPRDALGIEQLQAKYDQNSLRIKPKVDIDEK